MARIRAHRLRRRNCSANLDDLRWGRANAGREGTSLQAEVDAYIGRGRAVGAAKKPWERLEKTVLWMASAVPTDGAEPVGTRIGGQRGLTTVTLAQPPTTFEMRAERTGFDGTVPLPQVTKRR
jgi:hypothetical protein